ncbi:MAG: right-handed parallel beta-helix repeat-containing protein [Planctomycetota bacterium]
MRSALIVVFAWLVLVISVSAQGAAAPMPETGGIMKENPFLSGPVAQVTVPGDYASIMLAIHAAEDYWVILVNRGTYYEHIDFQGKNLTLKSIGGPEHTVLDGKQSDCVVRIHGGEGREAILDGFTITNGKKYAGGGILIYGESSPTIRNNVITRNYGNEVGGVWCGGGSPLILNNRITRNLARGSVIVGAGVGCESGYAEIVGNYIAYNVSLGSGYIRGGGIGLKAGSALIANNLIMHNQVTGEGTYGAGICLDWGSYAKIVNNLIAFNESDGVGGGICVYWGVVDVMNNTLYENMGTFGAEFYFSGDDWGDKSTLTSTILWNSKPEPIINHTTNELIVSHCDVSGGYPGICNIDEDPLFVDPENNNFTLMQEPCQPGYRSPCIDAGHDFAGILGFQESTTRTDREPDQEYVDIGFHYGPFDPAW